MFPPAFPASFGIATILIINQIKHTKLSPSPFILTLILNITLSVIYFIYIKKIITYVCSWEVTSDTF